MDMEREFKKWMAESLYKWYNCFDENHTSIGEFKTTSNVQSGMIVKFKVINSKSIRRGDKYINYEVKIKDVILETPFNIDYDEDNISCMVEILNSEMSEW